MTIKDNVFLVSKIRKIKIKGFDEPKYLVKWFQSSSETWEPGCNFPDEIETYPGYYDALNNIYRVKKKNEKLAIQVMINYLKNPK